MAIATISPVTGEVLKSFAELTLEELEEKLARAASAAASYRLTTAEKRVGWVSQAADHLEEEADAVSRLITTEMGKTLRAAQEEVAKCVRGLRFYTAEAPKFLQDRPGDGRSVGAKQTYVTYQPLGVVLAVMPWNLPLWQAMRFAAPALMAGNVGLLKHASNVPKETHDQTLWPLRFHAADQDLLVDLRVRGQRRATGPRAGERHPGSRRIGHLTAAELVRFSQGDA
ncbi:aldehyde dehydrogenase family protein [Streptomyces sp. NPDC058690]|uniref:aldehyde dehydrogenase family protein n=1 Tax=Streptomyces sp. NPDC058690 TaxID=3346600 RepID=UPI0036695845